MNDTGFDPYDYYTPGVPPPPIVPRKEPLNPEEQEEFDAFWSLMEALEIEEQGERAKNLCASSSFATTDGYIMPMFCGNWRVCERCFKHRVKVWHKRVDNAIEKYAKECPDAVWQYKAFSHEAAVAARKAGIPYLSFPMENDVTILVSPEFADGEPLPLLPFTLKRLMEQWVVTPRGMRPSRSRRFVDKKAERTDKPQPMLMIGASAAKVGKVAEAAGAHVQVLADGLTREFMCLDLMELAYELLAQDINVKLIANSTITPLDLYGTIFKSIRERRAAEAENSLPREGGGLR